MIDFSLAITKEIKDANAAAQVLAAIAARRYQAETGGLTLNGMFIDTGRDSQQLITGARLAGIDDPSYICNWKTPAGFLPLDAETIKVIATAVRAHVQTCFDREAALQDLVKKGTFKDYLLEKGWPTYEPVQNDAEDGAVGTPD